MTGGSEVRMVYCGCSQLGVQREGGVLFDNVAKRLEGVLHDRLNRERTAGGQKTHVGKRRGEMRVATSGDENVVSHPYPKKTYYIYIYRA